MIALRSFLIIALCLPAPALATRVIETFPVELSARDRELVLAAACRDPHGVDVESIAGLSYEKQGRVEGADVICATSSVISGVPMQYSGRCYKQRRRWNCDDLGPSTYVSSASSRLHFDVKKVGAADAVAMIDAIVRQRSFDEIDLRSAVEGWCRISKLDEDSWKLGCDKANLMVTRDHFPDGTLQFRVFLADRGD